MTLKEKAKEIRKELKNIGINSKQVSIRVRSYSAIKIEIKGIEALKKLKDIEKVAKKYEKYEYDMVNGEILSGGNDFILVNIEVSLRNEIIKKINEKFSKEKEINGVKVDKLDDVTMIRIGDDFFRSIKPYEDFSNAFFDTLLLNFPEKIEGIIS